MTTPRTLAFLALALPALASGAEPARAGPLGVTAFGSLEGGGAVAGSDSDASRGGLFGAEVGAGYELPQGFRPELALALNLSPRSSLSVRPGLRYFLEGYPFFARAALDFASPRSSWRMRWVLAGAGAELRLTDVLGAFAEADLGIPLASKAGLGFLFRGGVSFRL
jgi:hypothetical protein